ncbi:MAG: GNAT family N-acetyltransferase [Magnetospiraceae bacterium]
MRTITITHDMTQMDWGQLNEIYRAERAKDRDAATLRAAFAGSHGVVFALENGRIVGAARAISDGVSISTVIDVAVAFDAQGIGVGRAMMEALLRQLPDGKVYLATIPGKEGFYEKLGFSTQGGAMALGAGGDRLDLLSRIGKTELQ